LSRCSAPFEERRAFGLLYRSRSLDMNALELEHAKLGGRAAWRGKTPIFPPVVFRLGLR
jgi:hypothetical protein